MKEVIEIVGKVIGVVSIILVIGLSFKINQITDQCKEQGYSQLDRNTRIKCEIIPQYQSTKELENANNSNSK